MKKVLPWLFFDFDRPAGAVFGLTIVPVLYYLVFAAVGFLSYQNISPRILATMIVVLIFGNFYAAALIFRLFQSKFREYVAKSTIMLILFLVPYLVIPVGDLALGLALVLFVPNALLAELIFDVVKIKRCRGWFLPPIALAALLTAGVWFLVRSGLNVSLDVVAVYALLGLVVYYLFVKLVAKINEREVKSVFLYGKVTWLIFLAILMGGMLLVQIAAGKKDELQRELKLTSPLRLIYFGEAKPEAGVDVEAYRLAGDVQRLGEPAQYTAFYQNNLDKKPLYEALLGRSDLKLEANFNQLPLVIPSNEILAAAANFYYVEGKVAIAAKDKAAAMAVLPKLDKLRDLAYSGKIFPCIFWGMAIEWRKFLLIGEMLEEELLTPADRQALAQAIQNEVDVKDDFYRGYALDVVSLNDDLIYRKDKFVSYKNLGFLLSPMIYSWESASVEALKTAQKELKTPTERPDFYWQMKNQKSELLKELQDEQSVQN